MKLIITITLLLTSSLLLSQEFDLDLLYEEETIPCEDVIDYESKAYKKSLDLGLLFFEYSFSECDNSGQHIEQVNRISSIERRTDTLIYNFQLFRNCCGGSLASVEIVDSATWNFIMLSQEDGGCSECFCNCCFSVKIKVVNLSNSTPINYMLNQEPIVVSDTAINRYTKSIDYWENGEVKTDTRFNCGKPEFRFNFDQNGNKTSTDWFDKNGELVKTTENPNG